MGKIGRAIAAGVSSGLTTLGRDLERKEEQKRVDERLSKDDAFKERQLSIQEKDAELRAEAAKRQKFFDDTKINHSKMLKNLAGAGSNLKLQAEALTNFFPDKRIYRFNTTRAEQEGAWGVMDISFLDKDKITGEIKPDPTTGLPMEIQTKAPTNEIIFKTQGDYENFKSKLASPELYLAYASQNLTEEMAIRRSNAVADAAAGTKQGKSKLELEKQQAELAKQSAALKKKTDPNIRAGGALGTKKIREQGFNQFANNLSKELGVSVSADTAKKIAAINDTAKVRNAFIKLVSQALDPEDKTTRSDFIEAGIEQGLPREFLDRYYGNAEATFNDRSEEKDAIGSDGWFGNLIDSMFN